MPLDPLDVVDGIEIPGVFADRAKRQGGPNPFVWIIGWIPPSQIIERSFPILMPVAAILTG